MTLNLPKLRPLRNFPATGREQRLARARSIIADCMRALIHAADESAMLQDICRIVVELGGHRSAWIGFAEHDEGKTVRPVASAGLPLGEAHHLRLTWADQPRGRGAVGVALRTRRPGIVEDYFAQARYAAWREFAATHGFRSGVALPLLVDEACSGVLMINSPEARRFDAEEVALLDELAGDIAFGIRALRARQDQARTEQALRESERRFADLAALASDWFWETDANGCFTFVSRGFFEASGEKPEDVLGRPLARADMVGVGDAEWRAHVEAVKARRPFRKFEYARRVAGGERLWIESAGKPAFDAGGNFTGYRGTSRDITGRKLAEQALRESERRFADLTKHASDWIYEIDAKGCFTYISPRFFEVSGLKPEDVLGRRPDASGVSGIGEAAARAYLADLKAHRPYRDVEYAKRKADGGWLWICANGQPVFDPDGRFMGYRGTSRDITERKLAEQALAERESVFREFAANTPGFYWLRDVGSDHIVYVSPGWERITGRPAPRVRTDFADIVHPEDSARVLADMSGRPHGGIDHEYRIVRPDGEVRWVQVRTFPVRDANGVVYRIAGIGEDVTERRQGERALEAKTEVLRVTLESMGQGISLIDRDLRLVAWNRRFRELLDFPEAICHADTTLEDLLRFNALRGDYGPGDPEELVSARVGLAKRFEPHCFERVRPNGTVLEVRGVPAPGGGFVTTYTDITERRRSEAALRESELQLRQLAANVPEAYWIEEVASGSILFLSPAFTRITGWLLEAGATESQQMRDIVCAEDCRRILTAAAEARLGGFDEQYRIVRPDGTTRWVHTRTFPIRNARGEVYRLAGVTEDISEKMAADDRLEQMALYDTLTSLPNRTLFYRNVQQTLERVKTGDGLAALMFLDLDRFKNVNDTLGHAVGDELLRQVATRLVKALRVRDTLGRLGGDEFAVLLSNLTRAEDAGVVAGKILKALAEPFLLEGHEMFVTASIGIAIAPADGDAPDALIRAADTAMYRAKKSGRNNARFYKAKMNERALERLQLEAQLRRALERDEFRLHYQPKLRLADSRLSGAEALLRWNHPERGLVSPADFIPLLEETGMIVPVGAWIVREACRQIRAWRDAGLPALRIAINLSPRQFTQKDLAESVRRAARETGVDPKWLEFEITESTLMSHADETIAILTQLKDAGCALSVDDFGTGYSSLAYLKRFPIDTLKIDRSFVQDATTNRDDAAIVRAIIGMAHDLNLKVVAEGVETGAQLELLRERDCDEIQGYLVSRPVDAGAFADLVRDFAARSARACAPLENFGTVAAQPLAAAAMAAS